MELIEVDMLQVAQALYPDRVVTPEPGEQPIRIAKDTNLWRFNVNGAELHILTDGCGGAEAILNPATAAETRREFQLGDYVGGVG